MKLSELISYVGDENVQFQNIMHSSPLISKGKNNATVTFCTANDKANSLINEAVGVSESEWVAMVIWIPRSMMPSLPEKENQ